MLKETKIIGTVHYKKGMFATEKDFDKIREIINDDFEPIVVRASQMLRYDNLMLSNLRIVMLDDDDIDDNGNCILTTMYLDKKAEFGEIIGVPPNEPICTLVMKKNIK